MDILSVFEQPQDSSLHYGKRLAIAPASLTTEKADD